MGLFKRKKQEIRADTETSILTFFGITGEITRESAMNIPTVSACINKIGETVSRLPIKLFCRKNESVSEIKNDSRIRLLNGETGDTLSNVDLWKAAAEDYFLGGGAWIFVNSEHLKVKSLHYVDSRNISVISNNNPIFKAFRVLVNGTEYYDFKFIKLLRKTRDGYTNIPIQQENSRILSAAYNSLMLENMMNSSGCKPGFLKSKNRLSTEAIKAIKDGYRKVYDNQETREKVLVLNDGVEFEPISSTAAELQMNENKKTNSVEICKLFGFPHTIIDGGASEDDNKKFISAVISFLNQVETELDRVLLLETEKEKGFYFAFDTKELTRGNVLERYQAYEIARRNNILQIDEIRREEDFKPLNFDFLTLNLSDVLINPQTMEVFTPNTGQSKNLITGEQRTLELRHNPNHDDKGRFCSGGGGGNSAKPVDKSKKDDIIKESNEKKPITEITEKAVENVPNVKIQGYTDEQCAEIQKQHKELLKYSRDKNNGNEVAFVLDSNLQNRKEFKGSDDRLDFGSSLYGKDLTVMHNHPRNSSYSKTDIIFFGSNSNVKTLTIVKNNGKVEYLTKSKDFDSMSFKLEYDRLHKKIVKNGTDSENAKFVKTLLSKTKSGVVWSERG